MQSAIIVQCTERVMSLHPRRRVRYTIEPNGSGVAGCCKLRDIKDLTRTRQSERFQ